MDDNADDTANNTKDSKTCNCRQKIPCPLNGYFLQSIVIYKATVTRKDNSTTETYIGPTKKGFKIRYRNHSASFRHFIPIWRSSHAIRSSFLLDLSFLH